MIDIWPVAFCIHIILLNRSGYRDAAADHPWDKQVILGDVWDGADCTVCLRLTRDRSLVSYLSGVVLLQCNLRAFRTKHCFVSLSILTLVNCSAAY